MKTRTRAAVSLRLLIWIALGLPMGVARAEPLSAQHSSGSPLNISTRLRVADSDNLDDSLIAGFIVQAPPGGTKRVILRGIGPSLAQAGISGTLADPVVALYAESGSSIAGNDNWRNSQEAEIQATTIPPTNNFESAIVANLPDGEFTALLYGTNGARGIGVVEVYDLDSSSEARLANLSTRGRVGTGDGVMIGGFIIGGDHPVDILLRAIGPSLRQAGVTRVLEDPTLQLRGANGDLIAENDNWQDTQRSAIEATTIPPGDEKESAIAALLPAGAYTAIVAGKDGGTGTGLVEVYHLR